MDGIVKNGIITTEELNQAGYDHPPRAAQDAKDLGFRLKRVKAKRADGHQIAGYVFHEWELEEGKEGRRLLPKTERAALIKAAGKKCQICGAGHNLQVDHRIPYEVAGESQRGQKQPFQVLCGKCNRTKSWSCEHCQNWLETKSFDVCRSCYWAEPSAYSHVAMQQQRRVDLVWIGEEVPDFDRLKDGADRLKISVSEEIKRILKTCY